MQKNARRIASALGVVVVFMAAMPAMAAVFRGSIAHASLLSGQSVAGTVPIEWSWNSGTRVDSSDTVNLYTSTDGTAWKWVSNAPIRQGVIDLDTTTLPDFTYYLRLKVAWEPAQAIVYPIVVDNTSPEVLITRPSQGQVIVDDETPEAAIVAGHATLEASAFDNLSGVGTVTWILDEEEIATGAVAEYDFSQVPGPHTLSVIVTDLAGNQGSHSVQIVALPGPSAAIDGTETPEVPEQDPPAVPSPSVPDTGELPGLPDLGELPSPPDTGELPPAPDAGELPDAGDPPTLPEDPSGEPPTVPNVIPTP